MNKLKKIRILGAGITGLLVPGIFLVSCGSTATSENDDDVAAEIALSTNLDNLSLASYNALNANWDGYGSKQTSPEEERDRFAEIGYNLIVAGTTNNANLNISSENYDLVSDLLNSPVGQIALAKLDSEIKSKADFITYFNDFQNLESQENEVILLIITMIANNRSGSKDPLLSVNLQQALRFSTNQQKDPESFDFSQLNASQSKTSVSINGVALDTYTWTSEDDVKLAMLFFLQELEINQEMIFNFDNSEN